MDNPSGHKPFPHQGLGPQWGGGDLGSALDLPELIGGTLGMRVKRLQAWLQEATWEKTIDTTNWSKVVSLV